MSLSAEDRKQLANEIVVAIEKNQSASFEQHGITLNERITNHLYWRDVLERRRIRREIIRRTLTQVLTWASIGGLAFLLSALWEHIKRALHQ